MHAISSTASVQQDRVLELLVCDDALDDQQLRQRVGRRQRAHHQFFERHFSGFRVSSAIITSCNGSTYWLVTRLRANADFDVL
jgi:hypothetical protein